MLNYAGEAGEAGKAGNGNTAAFTVAVAAKRLHLLPHRTIGDYRTIGRSV